MLRMGGRDSYSVTADSGAKENVASTHLNFKGFSRTQSNPTPARKARVRPHGFHALASNNEVTLLALQHECMVSGAVFSRDEGRIPTPAPVGGIAFSC